MKTFILYAVILFFGVSSGSGIRVTYKQKLKKSHILNSSLPIKIKKSQLKKANQLKTFTLDIRDKYSYFYGEESPTIFCKKHDRQESYMLLKSDLNMDKPYAVRWENKDFDWQVDKSKQKEILGHNCFFATFNEDGFEYKAWFAPDLDYSDGPYRFRGLGGLILELETKVLIIKTSKIENNQDVLFSIPESFKYVSRKFLGDRLMMSKR